MHGKKGAELIVGGGIGFLATIATFIFQDQQSNKRHKSDLADQRSHSRNEVISRRLNQIEQQAAKTFGTSSLDRYNRVAEESLARDKHHGQEVADIRDQLRKNYSYVLKGLDEYRVGRLAES